MCFAILLQETMAMAPLVAWVSHSDWRGVALIVRFFGSQIGTLLGCWWALPPGRQAAAPRSPSAQEQSLRLVHRLAPAAGAGAGRMVAPRLCLQG